MGGSLSWVSPSLFNAKIIVYYGDSWTLDDFDRLLEKYASQRVWGLKSILVMDHRNERWQLMDFLSLISQGYRAKLTQDFFESILTGSRLLTKLSLLRDVS